MLDRRIGDGAVIEEVSLVPEFHPIFALRGYRRVRCPDGNYLSVYWKPKKAFLELERETQSTIRATAKILEIAKGHLGVEHHQKISYLLERLDSTSMSMQRQFYEAYEVYAADPCYFGAQYLEDRRREIHREGALFHLIITAADQIKILLAGNAAPDKIVEVIVGVMTSLTESLTRVFEQTKRDIEMWGGPK
jgi:hypothetical protein